MTQRRERVLYVKESFRFGRMKEKEWFRVGKQKESSSRSSSHRKDSGTGIDTEGFDSESHSMARL